MRLALAALPLAVVAACSSFSGSDAPILDAGAANDSGAPGDAGSDGATANDAEVTARDPAIGPDPCAAQPVYCNDFLPSGASFDGLSQYGSPDNGTYAFTADGNTAGSGAVALTIPVNKSDEVYLTKGQPTYTYDIEVNLDDCKSPQPTVFFGGLYDSSLNAGVRLYIDVTNTIGVDNSSIGHASTKSLGHVPTGWFHVQVAPDGSGDVNVTVSPDDSGSVLEATVTEPTMTDTSYFIGPYIPAGNLGPDHCTVAVDWMRIALP